MLDMVSAMIDGRANTIHSKPAWFD